VFCGGGREGCHLLYLSGVVVVGWQNCPVCTAVVAAAGASLLAYVLSYDAAEGLGSRCWPEHP
jgi:hypothetical protein